MYIALDRDYPIVIVLCGEVRKNETTSLIRQRNNTEGGFQSISASYKTLDLGLHPLITLKTDRDYKPWTAGHNDKRDGNKTPINYVECQ